MKEKKKNQNYEYATRAFLIITLVFSSAQETKVGANERANELGKVNG